MNALDLLIADHNRVRGLFARFKEAEEAGDRAAMFQLSARIMDELDVHTTIEEEIFYPAVHDTTEEISKVVDEGIQEHHVAKVLIEELRRLGSDSEAFTPKMQVLIENVEHHAEEEETEMFPPLRSSCSGEELEELAARLERRKKELGAPVLEDKIDLTDERLRKLASAQQIPGRSKMSHDELAATVAPD